MDETSVDPAEYLSTCHLFSLLLLCGLFALSPPAQSLDKMAKNAPTLPFSFSILLNITDFFFQYFCFSLDPSENSGQIHPETSCILWIYCNISWRLYWDSYGLLDNLVFLRLIKILQDTFWDSIEILLRFIWNSIAIHLKFYPDPIEILSSFFKILSIFYWNSMEIRDNFEILSNASQRLIAEQVLKPFQQLVTSWNWT